MVNKFPSWEGQVWVKEMVNCGCKNIVISLLHHSFTLFATLHYRRSTATSLHFQYRNITPSFLHHSFRHITVQT
jgi:hypothetical protein